MNFDEPSQDNKNKVPDNNVSKNKNSKGKLAEERENANNILYIERQKQEALISEFTPYFNELRNKLLADSLLFDDEIEEEEKEEDYQEILKNCAKESYIRTILQSLELTHERFFSVCSEQYDAPHLPNPLGLRTETLELYSRVVDEYTGNSWVPIQQIGNGIVLGHFLPNYPKPDLPPYMVRYVTITEKVYWDYQHQVKTVALDTIRKDNGYNLIKKEDYKSFWKDINHLTFIELVNLFLKTYHEKSPEYKKAQGFLEFLTTVTEDDGTVKVDFDDGTVKVDFDDENVKEEDRDSGIMGMKGKMDNYTDVWITSLESSLQNEFRDVLNIKEEILPVINVEEIAFRDDCKELLSEYNNKLEAVKAIPLFISDKMIGFVSPNMGDVTVQNYLRELFPEYQVKFYLTPSKGYTSTVAALKSDDDVETALNLFTEGYGDDLDSSIESIADLDDGNYTEEDDRVINFVNQVLKKAIEEEASDIHFEVTGGAFKIRYRLDGKLVEMFRPFPIELAPFAVRRIKVLARMDQSKTREPLDGGLKIRISSKNKNLDLRIATCPVVSPGSDSIYEKCVMRILDDSVGPGRIDEVMWLPEQREMFKRVITNPYGIIIVTGPTGSGKSTTLYAVLNELNTPEKNIVTAEDPVERKLAGINQTPIMPPNTFARQLRSTLRMDPDVILVGEIRDEETADLAIKAAQTGHLVLTTLHANTAVDAIPRLDGLKTKRQDVASAILCFSAQRLVRRLCKVCKRKRPIQDPEAYMMTSRGIETELIRQGYLYDARGCPACNYQGYKGRLAIAEVLEVTGEFKELIEDPKVSANDIKLELARNGYKNMFANGLEAVARGETDFRELVVSIPNDMKSFEDRIREEVRNKK